MSQNSIWAWIRVTHRGESSADDKRPVCNKMPRQTFSRLRRLHQCTSNCTSGYRCRSPATPLPSQASPALMTTPVFHLPPPLDSFFSPSAHGSLLLCCLTRTTPSRPKQTRSTAQCSVWLSSCDSKGIERRS